MPNRRLTPKDFKPNNKGWYMSDKAPNIRFEAYTDKNNIVVGWVFEIYKKPFFWGKIGRKRWIALCSTNDFYAGLNFSLLKLK